MTEYLARSLNLSRQEASQIRTDYWKKYGATLLGMIKHHGTDPHHFLDNTHQFPNLRQVSHRPGSVPLGLKRLKGLRVLLTNAPRSYAVDLLKTLNLYAHVDAVIAIEDMVIHGQWRPKPSMWLWPRLQRALKRKRMVFVDDTRGHLHQAASHGISGVWITKPGLGFKALARSGNVKHRVKQFRQVAGQRF